MDYLTVLKLSKEAGSQSTLSRFKATTAGKDAISKISPAEIAWGGIGAVAGGAGGFLLSKLLHTDPSTRTRILYTLAGASAGAFVPNAVLSNMSGGEGVANLRERMRLEHGKSLQPAIVQAQVRAQEAEQSKEIRSQAQRQGITPVSLTDVPGLWDQYLSLNTDDKLDNVLTYVKHTGTGFGAGWLADTAKDIKNRRGYNKYKASLANATTQAPTPKPSLYSLLTPQPKTVAAPKWYSKLLPSRTKPTTTAANPTPLKHSVEPVKGIGGRALGTSVGAVTAFLSNYAKRNAKAYSARRVDIDWANPTSN